MPRPVGFGTDPAPKTRRSVGASHALLQVFGASSSEGAPAVWPEGARTLRSHPFPGARRGLEPRCLPVGRCSVDAAAVVAAGRLPARTTFVEVPTRAADVRGVLLAAAAPHGPKDHTVPTVAAPAVDDVHQFAFDDLDHLGRRLRTPHQFVHGDLPSPGHPCGGGSGPGWVRTSRRVLRLGDRSGCRTCCLRSVAPAPVAHRAVSSPGAVPASRRLVVRPAASRESGAVALRTLTGRWPISVVLGFDGTRTRTWLTLYAFPTHPDSHGRR